MTTQRPYRARRVDTNELVYGWKFVCKGDDRTYIISADYSAQELSYTPALFDHKIAWHEVHPDSVSQSTGRKDKHGVDAYGGDRVKSKHYGAGEIIWAGDGWVVQAEDMKFALHYEFEISNEGEQK